MAEQFQQALVEPQIADRPLDLTTLDQKGSITSHTCKRLRSRLNFANIPQSCDQQPLVKLSNQLLHRLRRPLPTNHQVNRRLAKRIRQRQLVPGWMSILISVGRDPARSQGLQHTVLDKRQLALRITLAIKRRTNLQGMIHIIVETHIFSQNLLAQPSRKVASTLLVLSHPKIRRETCTSGHYEEEQHLTPSIRINHNVKLARRDLRLGPIQFRAFESSLRQLHRIQLRNIRKSRQCKSCLVAVVSVHRQREVAPSPTVVRLQPGSVQDQTLI